jgi:hypothetical protein
MEQNFQTSFIPKKPIIEQRVEETRPIGIFTIISIFILFTILLVSGGLYFYRSIKVKNIAQMQADLNLAKNRFEPSKITELQVLDKRLKASTEILNKHITVTPIFKALQDITMKTVRYTNFNYSIDGNKVKVSMSGIAVGYRSIALQSDLFTKNKNLIDPVFSNLALDDKGNVTFSLDFFLDMNFVDYKQNTLTQS